MRPGAQLWHNRGLLAASALPRKWKWKSRGPYCTKAGSNRGDDENRNAKMELEDGHQQSEHGQGPGYERGWA